jgi:hypothetical protein
MSLGLRIFENEKFGKVRINIPWKICENICQFGPVMGMWEWDIIYDEDRSNTHRDTNPQTSHILSWQI